MCRDPGLSNTAHGIINHALNHKMLVDASSVKSHVPLLDVASSFEICSSVESLGIESLVHSGLI